MIRARTFNNFKEFAIKAALVVQEEAFNGMLSNSNPSEKKAEALQWASSLTMPTIMNILSKMEELINDEEKL